MNNLKMANVDKCLTLLNEFYDAVAVDDSNPGLLFKKKEAGRALNHLEMLFKAESDQPEEEDDEGGNCEDCCGEEVQIAVSEKN